MEVLRHDDDPARPRRVCSAERGTEGAGEKVKVTGMQVCFRKPNVEESQHQGAPMGPGPGPGPGLETG